MRDDAILAGGIHGLENQQHGVAAGGVQKLLLGAQPLDVILENGLVIGIVAVDPRRVGGPLGEVHLGAFANPIVF